MRQKTILAVIGAGEGALPILQKAKEIGVKSLAFGHADSLAREYADIFVEADIFDFDFIKKQCLEHNVQGVIASSEVTTEVAALLASELGLPGNDVKQGFGARNKYIMRTKIEGVSSVKQPKFQLYQEDCKYDYPIVVKALDSCGKRGISIAYNQQDLRKAVSYSKEYSKDGEVLIEEYLSGGREFSIECICGNGCHDIVQYTEKESSGPPHFTETAHHQPAELSDDLKNRIDKAVKDILQVLGIHCGMAHMELKVIDDDIYFIEVGARGGGDHIADTLTINSTDCDYFKAAIDCSLGLYEHKEIRQVAYTGIYFHCKQHEELEPLFQKAKTADWCICNTIMDDAFHVASSNVETAESGYIIYRSNKKITLDNYKN